MPFVGVNVEISRLGFIRSADLTDFPPRRQLFRPRMIRLEVGPEIQLGQIRHTAPAAVEFPLSATWFQFVEDDRNCIFIVRYHIYFAGIEQASRSRGFSVASWCQTIIKLVWEKGNPVNFSTGSSTQTIATAILFNSASLSRFFE